MATHSSILSGKSHGQRSLGDYSPWVTKKLGPTEQQQTRIGGIGKVSIDNSSVIFGGSRSRGAEEMGVVVGLKSFFLF